MMERFWFTERNRINIMSDGEMTFEQKLEKVKALADAIESRRERNEL